MHDYNLIICCSLSFIKQSAETKSNQRGRQHKEDIRLMLLLAVWIHKINLHTTNVLGEQSNFQITVLEKCETKYNVKLCRHHVNKPQSVQNRKLQSLQITPGYLMH